LPRISEFYGISIYMFYEDHHPPHFHAIYGDREAVLVVGSLEVLNGALPIRASRLVKEWARRHRDELLANWERARSHLPLEKIAPLD